MFRTTTFRLCGILALILGIWTTAEARGKIAIDGLHGQPILETILGFDVIDLEELYPDIDFITIDAKRMPITDMLAEGMAQGEWVDSIAVDVPAGAQALYVALDVDYSGPQVEQLPMLHVVSPDQSVTTGAYGMCHIDSPTPGEYTVVIAWMIEPVYYRIGTGPHIWDVYPLEDYDVVMRMLGFTWMLFRGIPTPYSDEDFTQLQQMLDASGGLCLFYDGGDPIAEKPIIHVQNFASNGATIQVNIPGKLTYALPQPQARAPLVWQVPPGNAEAELYYEGAFRRPLNFVARESSGKLVNRSWATVRDLKLIDFVPGRGYRIRDIGTLLPGEESSSQGGTVLPYLAACQRLDGIFRQEALEAGMTADEVQLFFKKYTWAYRVIADVCAADAPVCLYRVEGEDYDALLPMTSEPVPAEVCRILWVYSMLPETAGSNHAVHPRAAIPRVSQAAHRVGMLHEYGFMRETYGGDALDDLDEWGWHFYDLGLEDPTDYVNSPYEVIFHTQGASPLASRLMQNVSQVIGMFSCGVQPAAGETEVVLSGDDDTGSGDPGSPFPPGSYPPVVVARQEAAGGRLAGLADLYFPADEGDNVQFMNNLFEWIGEGATGEGADIDMPVAVVETTLYEGTWGETRFCVMNIGDAALVLQTELPALSWVSATGPTDIILGGGEEAEYVLNWTSGSLTPGYYETQWTFTSNDANEPSLTWPVRLRVVSQAASEPRPQNPVVSTFELSAPYPNPFNASV
ncbi:hypothetical protein KKB28_00005, partial [bacterium]|nr:hypothetical protein [bacterium]